MVTSSETPPSAAQCKDVTSALGSPCGADDWSLFWDVVLVSLCVYPTVLYFLCCWRLTERNDCGVLPLPPLKPLI